MINNNKRGTMEQKLSLILLGITAVVAMFGLLTLQLRLEGAVTAAERTSPGSEPWTIQGENCAWKAVCVEPEPACGGYLAHYDGYAAGCISSAQAKSMRTCVLTTMRMGSHECSTSDPIYATRCVCP